MSVRPGFPKHVFNKTSVLCEQLMKTCLDIKITSNNAHEPFEKLYAIIEELIRLQRKFCFLRNLEAVAVDRISAVNELCTTNQRLFEHHLVVEECGDHGLGLVTHTALEAGSAVLHIPRQMMLDTSGHWDMAEFVRKDPIASEMENVALSFRVLSELMNWKKSTWHEYILTLPSTYSTLLYLTPNDLIQLKGSPVLVVVVSNYQSICRQYAYFFNRFQALRLTAMRNFCFEDFRWAVSTVMSRNNLIPTGPDLCQRMCLVPIWDMINHSPGHITTDFDPTKNELIFYSMASYDPGNEVLMDYGRRTNAEFLLFAGFVPTHNPHNRVIITLATSKSDRLAMKRQQLLQVVSLTNPLNCSVSMDPSSLHNLLAFARVFVMSEDQLEHYLTHPEKAAHHIRNTSVDVSHDREAVDFLAKRINVLILMYGNVPEENDDLFKQMAVFEQNCARLKRQEINILRASMNFLLSTLEDQADPVTCFDGLSLNESQTTVPSTELTS